MDNLTHTFFGGFLVETTATPWYRKHDPESLPKRRFQFWALSILANNFPDFDFLYSHISGEKLGYLLHHRGHTHTFLMGFLEALLILGIFATFEKTRKWQWTKRDWQWALGLSVMGPFFHIFLDSLNNYGVHPFWPVNNSWFYGDTLFIIEPWFWIILLPAWVLAINSNLKYLPPAFSIFFILLGVLWKLISWKFFLVWILAAGGTYFAFLKIREKREWFLIGGVVLFLTLFKLLSYLHYKFTADDFTQTQKSYELRDMIITSFPANPFCAAVNAYAVNRDKYLIKRGTSFLWPWSAETCPPFRDNPTTVPYEIISETNSNVYWKYKIELPIEPFRQLAHENCLVKNFLKFARLPYLLAMNEGWIVGDARYDFEKRLGFAEFKVQINPNCPNWIPPWDFPRRKEFID